MMRGQQMRCKGTNDTINKSTITAKRKREERIIKNITNTDQAEHLEDVIL